jgi:hypothetical protein
MEYNVNSSLLAGHGFWGDLSLMNTKQRLYVGRQVKQSKRILPFIAETEPRVIGKVGDSPEIYSIINSKKAAGQVISFSEKPSEYKFEQDIKSMELLAVLNHPYRAEEDLLRMGLVFGQKESTSAIFVLPNEGSGISIISSTAAISDASSDGKQLRYQVEGSGSQVIIWPRILGKPKIREQRLFDVRMEEKENQIRIEIKPLKDNAAVIIASGL